MQCKAMMGVFQYCQVVFAFEDHCVAVEMLRYTVVQEYSGGLFTLFVIPHIC